jgi:hypothetical protein
MSRGHLTTQVKNLGSGTVTSQELKARLDRLGISRREAAAALGLSLDGLFHQMRDRKPNRQTEMLLEALEQKLENQRRVA